MLNFLIYSPNLYIPINIFTNSPTFAPKLKIMYSIFLINMFSEMMFVSNLSFPQAIQ